MAFSLRPDPNDDPSPAPEVSAGDEQFRLSSHPVLANGGATPGLPEGDDALPRSYGTKTLCLMSRDPETLFAYWDIDWASAFGSEPPHDRKVHLRVRDEDGEEVTSLEVEPMAGSCYVPVANGDSEYVAEIGYFQPAKTWNSVASSEPVATPPDSATAAEPDFATVPFHLSFQRMIDLFRVSKHENESLTAMLNDLRERASSAAIGASETFTPQEREIVRALDEARAQQPPLEPSVPPAKTPDLWARHTVERILGFGHSSPTGGFGGSSRPL